jgi:hypothetical protein
VADSLQPVSLRELGADLGLPDPATLKAWRWFTPTFDGGSASPWLLTREEAYDQVKALRRMWSDAKVQLRTVDGRWVDDVHCDGELVWCNACEEATRG